MKLKTCCRKTTRNGLASEPRVCLGRRESRPSRQDRQGVDLALEADP